MVGPGALKPSDGDGIVSRRPLLLSLLCLLYSSHFLIFAPILVCIIIIIIIIYVYGIVEVYTITWLHSVSKKGPQFLNIDSCSCLRARWTKIVGRSPKILLYI